MSLKTTTFSVCVVAVFASLTLAMAGCSSDDGTAKETALAPATDTATIAVDGTTVVSSQEPAVIRNYSSAAFPHVYRTVDELRASDEAELIIKGRVVGYEDVYWHSWALRALQVEVEKWFKGESAATITVYEEGAVVPLKDVLPDVAAHVDTAALSEEQIENTVVDFTFEGAAHSKLGDNVIMFLYNNPNTISEGASYMQVMSVFGRFTLDTATGEYVRPDIQGVSNSEPRDSSVPEFVTRESSTSIEAKLAR